MLNSFWAGLSGLVYPPHCPVCQKHLKSFSPEEILCPRCQDTLVANIPPFCPKCSRHLRDVTRPKCAECEQRNPPFDFAWGACQYKDPLIQLIYQYKYHQRTYLRKFFVRRLIDFIENYRLDIAQFDIITSIPLFCARLRDRGYNQAQLLADPIARTYRIRLSSENLIRARNTLQQTSLSKKERWTNVHGAFRILNSAEFSGKNVLIIDDLLTTGATASEAAFALKKAGARTVGVLTLAITV